MLIYHSLSLASSLMGAAACLISRRHWHIMCDFVNTQQLLDAPASTALAMMISSLLRLCQPLIPPTSMPWTSPQIALVRFAPRSRVLGGLPIHSSLSPPPTLMASRTVGADIFHCGLVTVKMRSDGFQIVAEFFHKRDTEGVYYATAFLFSRRYGPPLRG